MAKQALESVKALKLLEDHGVITHGHRHYLRYMNATNKEELEQEYWILPKFWTQSMQVDFTW